MFLYTYIVLIHSHSTEKQNCALMRSFLVSKVSICCLIWKLFNFVNYSHWSQGVSYKSSIPKSTTEISETSLVCMRWQTGKHCRKSWSSSRKKKRFWKLGNLWMRLVYHWTLYFKHLVLVLTLIPMHNLPLLQNS